SYAREDSAFVAALNEALQKCSRETWIDWAGIAPSAEWYQEILQALEAANTVIFVISTHSAISRFCTNEIAHAIKHNKRIIPIFREVVREDLLPREVCDRQWIFCRESDDFDLAFASLISAMDTDLDWVRSHTRLLTRAIEWESHKRDFSFALRGRDLNNAEL